MRDFLRRAFLDHLALKVVALLLSVTLYIVVHADKDAVISFQLKVGYTMPSDRVVVSKLVDSVRVTVKGPWTRVKRFDDRAVERLHVDLSSVADGEYLFQEDLIRLPPGLRVTSINPPTMHVQFESRATRIVSVTPVVEGEPERGFRVEHRAASPSHVRVEGARSVVEAMTEVRTRPVSVAGRRDSFAEEVSLAPTNAAVTVVAPAPIRVDVTIRPEPAELTVTELPVQVRPPPGFPGILVAGASVSPPEVTVVLRGGRKAIEQVERARLAAYVDLHVDHVGRSEPRRVQVQISGQPDGVAVEVTPREVHLTVKPAAQKK